MSHRIWKYPLEITDRQVINLPAGAWELSVLTAGERLFLYALVDPDQPTEDMTIRIVGTGNPVEQDPGFFIGTVSMPPHVWHVFVE